MQNRVQQGGASTLLVCAEPSVSGLGVPLQCAAFGGLPALTALPGWPYCVLPRWAVCACWQQQAERGIGKLTCMRFVVDLPCPVQDSQGNFYDCCLTLQPAVVSKAASSGSSGSSSSLTQYCCCWACWRVLHGCSTSAWDAALFDTAPLL